MISILEVTTSDAVRASLGVDEEELDDAAFQALGVADELFLDLRSWLPSGSDLDTIVREGVDADRGTDEHVRYAHLSAYSKAFCGRLLAVGVENWRLTRLTDGNVDERRAEKIDVEALKEEFDRLMNKHREALSELLDPDVEVAVFSVMGVSSPTFDPVTG